mmetsp:Transcript_52110/g.156398  ORF Transcript_52110/g.156398 Transcript_52110/m.156398 type:complete len:233 (-) Transcript_52110:307-1005(-)
MDLSAGSLRCLLFLVVVTIQFLSLGSVFVTFVFVFMDIFTLLRIEHNLDRTLGRLGFLHGLHKLHCMLSNIFRIGSITPITRQTLQFPVRRLRLKRSDGIDKTRMEPIPLSQHILQVPPPALMVLFSIQLWHTGLLLLGRQVERVDCRQVSRPIFTRLLLTIRPHHRVVGHHVEPVLGKVQAQFALHIPRGGRRSGVPGTRPTANKPPVRLGFHASATEEDALPGRRNEQDV